MKTTKRKIPSMQRALVAACGMTLFATMAMAQTGGNKTFNGNGSTGFGGPIGTSTLQITDDTTNINCTFTMTEGNTGGNVLVLYIQPNTNSGFSSTANFTDTSDGIHTAISGNGGGNGNSVMTFLPGFTPSYAVGVQLGTFAGVYGLTNNAGFSYLGSANLNPSGTTTPGVYTLSFTLAQIGMTNGPAVVGQTFQIFGTFISSSAYRSSECVPGNDTGSQGWNPFTQTSGGVYTVGEVPTVSYPVTFQVDMSAMLQSGVFNPGGGDQVAVSGTFDSNGTNYLSTESNTNIYSVTYNDSNTLGTIESFSYTIYHGGGGSVPESTDPRTFMLTNTQTLPVIYFSSYAPTNSAYTVPLTFSVNMGVQIAAGNFDPANDSVYVFGALNENAALTWSGSAAMTPTLTNTNVYIGTFTDSNYPATPCQYKFVRYSTALSEYVYESRANRDYTTPASAETFPTVYFNDQTNVVDVSFTVDMAAQIYFGHFTPGVDTVAVAGNFTGWAPGVACTNDSNTNFYSITIPIFDAPGTTEQFKFITYGTGISGTDYESPGSGTPTIGGNRYFILPSTSTNLPAVAFSDQYLSDYLQSNVTVVFTVNMSNAVQFPSGTPFTTNDTVYINGDFLGWPTWSTLLPPMTQQGTNLLYTYTNVFTAGTPVIINYKYSIDGNDDEAGFSENHVRYIRSYGTYDLPVDIFGDQIVEPSFGDLATAAASGGHVPISWLGRPGVQLQSSSNLLTWVTVPATDATSSTVWPISGKSQYFRLVHPEQ